MTALEWLPLYTHRFMNSRRLRRMDAAHIGVYTLFMIEQWTGGALPNDDQQLSFLGRCTPSQAKAVLDACFDLTPDGWMCPEVEEIREEQEAKSQAFREAGRRGGLAKAANRASQAKAKLQPGSSHPLAVDKKRVEERRVRKEEKEAKTNRGNQTPVESSYTADFEELWRLYPKREGSNPKKGAFAAYTRTLKKNGATPEDLTTAVKNYGSFIRQSGQWGSRFVLRASTFFGKDEHWRETYEASPMTDADRKLAEKLNRFNQEQP